MIKLTVTNELIIEGLEPKFRGQIKKALTLDNPLFYKLMHATGNRAKAFYGTPQHFKYYKEQGDILIVPRGTRKRLIAFLEKANIQHSIHEELVCKPLSV